MPREQKNTMTSWIDGSFVYSTKVKNNYPVITMLNSVFVPDPGLGLTHGHYLGTHVSSNLDEFSGEKLNGL